MRFMYNASGVKIYNAMSGVCMYVHMVYVLKKQTFSLLLNNALWITTIYVNLEVAVGLAPGILNICFLSKTESNAESYSVPVSPPD
jgi:hypothetical protein